MHGEDSHPYSLLCWHYASIIGLHAFVKTVINYSIYASQLSAMVPLWCDGTISYIVISIAFMYSKIYNLITAVTNLQNNNNDIIVAYKHRKL